IDAVAADWTEDFARYSACSPRDDFEIRTAVAREYADLINEEIDQFQCTLPGANNASVAEAEEPYILTQIFQTVRDCSNDVNCAALEVTGEFLRRSRNVTVNQDRAFTASQGYKPIRVCRTITLPDGTTDEDCPIVTPPSVISASVDYAVAELPAQQLLQTDELDENVSSLTANLTNFSLSSPGGLLGLGGNDEFANNTFGPNGDVTYITQISNGTVSSPSIGAITPMDQALDAELEYEALQESVLNVILDFETRLANGRVQYEEYDGEPLNCFDLTLTGNLVTLKNNTIENIEISSTTQAILRVLIEDHNNAADLEGQNEIIAQFYDFERQGFFRTDLDNLDFQLNFLEIDFVEIISDFQQRLRDEVQFCEEEIER
ncbi:MAG: hypothetical protein AAFO91_16030, partial [Bacteroidota bacterium]